MERILKQRGESIEGVAGLEGKKASEWKYVPEYRIFWRFIALDQKRKHKDEILQLLESLQNAIIQKKIRKASPFAKEVRFIQDHLIQTYNAIKGDHVVIHLKEETGKKIIRAIRKIEKENETLSYPKSKAKPVALSGTPEKTIMASTEFTELSFPSIGLKGKWLELMGDPSPGFSAMISGKPKMGKSYLAVDFAGYLARNHGPVLYVAREERLDATLQKKLKEKDVAHPELFVSDHLPEDLVPYQFIFLDSVNKLGLNPEDLDRMKASNPGKSFIFIFQTTKDGKFRGSNEFQHDVDVVIEIPERGKAIQFGRFNQGGEMAIFPEASTDLTLEDNVPFLAGINRKKMKENYPAWTKPEFMGEKDHKTLRHIYDLYKEGRMKEAMDYASRVGDTAIREQIPSDIWLEMGGKINSKAKARSGKNKAKTQEEILKSFQDREDNLNPVYLFSLTHSQLLSEALMSEFDVQYLIRRELANRGLDESGNWVGFPKAREIHQVGN